MIEAGVGEDPGDVLGGDPGPFQDRWVVPPVPGVCVEVAAAVEVLFVTVDEQRVPSACFSTR